MNNKTKLVMVCGFALTTFLATQQTVKADTATDSQQVENVATVSSSNQQAVSQATSTETPQVTDASGSESTSSLMDYAKDNQQTATDNQAATTQADASAANITQIKGVVQTKHNTFLYTQDGKQVSNRMLAANTPWVTDQKMDLNGASYYRVATNEYTNTNDVTMQYGNAASGVVRVKQDGAVNYQRNDQGFVRNGQANQAANSVWKYNKTDSLGGLTYYQIANNVWLNSDDATIAPAYQNPNGWLQIHNTQIQPSGGAIGYDLYNGVEGIKTYLVRKYFGYSNAHTIYDGAVASSVRSFQSRNGLPVTGIVNLATWKTMGYSEADWYGIDSYVAPLQTNITSTRSDHIEAMINQAYKYIGKPWISGAASMPAYGVDCSGLVTQALYASGIDSAPISNIQHAQPGHEWNSRDYWADDRLPRVNFNNRQRGDLIFFADPSTGVVWHVGILLNPDTMIESWPFAVQVHSIYSSRGTIVGVKRVFN
ncbi:peptidoglycan endopeptidase [Companilactobacillus zhachilii]|uniref:Peptidoglycan endopeptidase n=1 Tax=Companilactobacillus zhachilii TaxID=2304606 RepID=A0A386PT16_9LACO|nr:peptidoglycan-binding protein [Companilactobacillus zhachilii]AYE38238.1 peptidoglycan endopeptidase [Companilactobacillus zhachilii]